MHDQFWNHHYKNFSLTEPSPFAVWCIDTRLKSTDTVVELGCGNGRDGLAIARKVARYVGLDSCPVAINSFTRSAMLVNDDRACRVAVEQIDFTDFDFRSFAYGAERLVLYSRFSLHSVDYSAAERLFNNISKLKDFPWVLMLEARTIYDPLYGQGEEVGLHEFRTDHYRRFIDPNNFLQQSTQKFSVRYFELNKGFAPFNSDDPLIMRAVLCP
jgi:SAM-dependent methyltransferase